MRSSLTYHDIANTVRMTRSLYTGTIIIVEGTADVLFYANFIDKSLCRLIDGITKENVINALDVLESHGSVGIAAIVDADFQMVTGSPILSKNLLMTDTHDLEMMILMSPALEKLLGEFGSAKKIDNAKKILQKDVRSILISAGLPLGYLRWISLIENLRLDFNDLSFRKFIDKDNLNIDLIDLIKEVLDNTRNHTLPRGDLLSQLIDICKRKDNPLQVCCGHDLVCILSIGLCKLFSTNNTTEVAPEILERSLRLAYEGAYFVKTTLYKFIKAWETANPPYKICQ